MGGDVRRLMWLAIALYGALGLYAWVLVASCHCP